MRTKPVHSCVSTRKGGCLEYELQRRKEQRCKGCREVTRLVGEVGAVRQVMESTKRIITGLGLEEKGEETGDRVAELGKAKKCEKVMIPDNSTEGCQWLG